MPRPRMSWFVMIAMTLAGPAFADSPSASYIFPAGGQRGTTVHAKVGGVNLNSKAGFEMLGPGVEGPVEIRPVETIWFEGPLLTLTESQQAEDYPKDYGATIKIASDAPVGARAWRVWTSQGACGALPFIIGDYPEIVENETLDSLNAEPVIVPPPLPVTINGRIFPREDVDTWSVDLKAGEVLSATVDAGRIGSPIDPWIEAVGPSRRTLAEIKPLPWHDGRVAFVAPEAGRYLIRVRDVNMKGSQSHTYRMTLAVGPSIETIFPLGGQRGKEVRFLTEGLGLTSPTYSLLLPTAGKGSGSFDDYVAIPSAGSTLLEIDDLPEVSETEPNQVTGQATKLDAPGVGNGRIDKAGDVDLWSVALNKGMNYVVELRAARLGSRLDGMLRLTDALGKELAKAEGTPALDGDPLLNFSPPETGLYLIRVNDRFRSRGGSHWAYRLRVAETPPPDFRLTFSADALSLPRGGVGKLRVEAERIGGFSEPIALDVQGLPEGVSTPNAVIAANETALELAFKVEAAAPIRSTAISIRGKSKLKGTEQERPAILRGAKGLPIIDTIRLAVALSPPFKIVGHTDFAGAARGSVRHRRFQIERNGFAGPLEVKLADKQARHLQGVTGPVMTLPANANEFEYAVTLPPWMEIGRTSRSVVTAVGIIREPDGTEHEVNYTSPVADLQVIAVVGPGLLGLEASRRSLTVIPGRTVELAVKLARSAKADGPAKVEMIADKTIKGITTEPLILDRGQSAGVLKIQCDDAMTYPTETRIVLRAVTMVGDDPATAETAVTLVREQPASE